MYYERFPEEQRKAYIKTLKQIGFLTRLFSDSECPYLFYRIQENGFCKCFNAENTSRIDDSVDACINGVGFGLKTWVGNDDQKIAEFGALRPQYALLEGIELVKKIAEYRNERICTTMQLHGLQHMVYHIIKRTPGEMHILEHDYDYIDLEKIKILQNGGENNVYFSDGKHIYHFSKSKNTLYMKFEDLVEIESFSVGLAGDPFEVLSGIGIEDMSIFEKTNNTEWNKHKENKLCLRLYTERKGIKVVETKSGLNQWNAGGRARNADEVYIPYPKKDRERKTFFPKRDTPFSLILPDGSTISAKVCQSDGKAIMSNPNTDLGQWLLRKVLSIKPGIVVTYETMVSHGIDSVIFTKVDDKTYKIDFSKIGTYERFYSSEE